MTGPPMPSPMAMAATTVPAGAKPPSRCAAYRVTPSVSMAGGSRAKNPSTTNVQPPSRSTLSRVGGAGLSSPTPLI